MASFGSDRPGTCNRPAAANHAGEQRFPALGGFVGEDDRADAIFTQSTRRPSAKAFAIVSSNHSRSLGLTISLLSFVLHGLGCLGRERIVWIGQVA